MTANKFEDLLGEVDDMDEAFDFDELVKDLGERPQSDLDFDGDS
jgi:hypothetical protein